jgi:hypothetical protein
LPGLLGPRRFAGGGFFVPRTNRRRTRHVFIQPNDKVRTRNFQPTIFVTVHGVGKCAFLSARACTRFLTRSLLREKAHVPAQVPARKARAGTRTQNGWHLTRIAYDNTRERLPIFFVYLTWILDIACWLLDKRSMPRYSFLLFVAEEAD